MATVTISFSLDAQRDRHLIRYLDGLPKGDKSKAIRDALEAHVKGGGVSLADVYALLKQVDRKVGQGGGYVLVPAGAVANAGQAEPEDPELAAALGNLGNLGL